MRTLTLENIQKTRFDESKVLNNTETFEKLFDLFVDLLLTNELLLSTYVPMASAGWKKIIHYPINKKENIMEEKTNQFFLFFHSSLCISRQQFSC